MKDIKYWERRVRSNTQPLAAGDLKLLLGSVFTELEQQRTELERLNEEIQSMGSKRSRSSSKKLEARSDSDVDSSGDA